MSKKILIIEDEVRISHLLKLYLEKESYQIVIDDNGETGLCNAIIRDYDLIIIDVLLPGKDGLKVLEELREIKTTPVIMISALCGKDEEELCFELGADEYILMPFSPREVVMKANQLMNNDLYFHISKKEKVEVPFFDEFRAFVHCDIENNQVSILF